MVGTSGRNGERREPVTASIRSVPDLASEKVSLIGLTLAGTCPPRRSCSAGAPPRECTGVIAMPAALATITPTKWGVPPAAVVAYAAFAGLALHHCTKSASDLTSGGTAGPMTYVSIELVAGATGVKSRSGS